MQAWTPYGASLLRSRMPPDEFSEFIETSRRTEHEALSQFLKPYTERLGDVTVELAHGEPEDAITGFVESHGVDVVVMGTVARTGIAGLVMGLERLEGRFLGRLASDLHLRPPFSRAVLDVMRMKNRA